MVDFGTSSNDVLMDGPGAFVKPIKSHNAQRVSLAVIVLKRLLLPVIQVPLQSDYD